MSGTRPQIMLVPAMMDALSFPLTLAMAVRKLKIDRAIVREGGRATVIIGGASRSASTTAEHRIIECSAAIPSPPPTAAAMFACSFASEKGLVSFTISAPFGWGSAGAKSGYSSSRSTGPSWSTYCRRSPVTCASLAPRQPDPCEVAMTSVMFFSVCCTPRRLAATRTRPRLPV